MITINGTDLSTIGFTYARRRLPRLGGESYAAMEIPGGIPVVMGVGVIQSARLSVDGAVSGSDAAQLRARIDSLAGLLRGEQVIHFADLSDREWVGRFSPAPSSIVAIGPAEITRAEQVTLEWLLADPRARARTETVVAGSAPALSLGTAPTPVKVTVTNGATAPITQVTVRLKAGAVVVTELVWNGSLAVGAALVVDASTFAVTNAGANAIDGLTDVSEFPLADPADAVTQAQVVVTGGGGHTISTTYRKRWW